MEPVTYQPASIGDPSSAISAGSSLALARARVYTGEDLIELITSEKIKAITPTPKSRRHTRLTGTNHFQFRFHQPGLGCGSIIVLQRLPGKSGQAVGLISAQRKIFAQRMTFPVIRQEYAAQIGMPVEDHAEQIIGLPLVPVCRAPNSGNARHVNIILVQHDF